MSSQVITFYEDEAKTNALYPRTKLSAISDDDGKALSETISELNTKTKINYLRSTSQTATSNGITFTYNSDGTYTVNGTATAQVMFLFKNSFIVNNLVGKKVLGCPRGGSNSTYSMILSYANKNYEWTEDSYETGNGVTIKNYPILSIGILIKNGISCNNLIFKPMITDDLSATYDDFVSYNDSLVTGSSQYFFGGIDTSRVLASNVTEYTATEDCWVKCQIGNPFGYGTLIYIDDVEVSINYIGGGFTNMCSFNRWFPLVNGQTVKIRCPDRPLEGYINIYGIAR